MIPVSQTYRDALTASNNKFDTIINITLHNDTVLRTLHNSDLRAFSVENAISDDAKFSMLGSVIVNQLTLTLDDLTEEFSERDFYGAQIIAKITPVGSSVQIKKGTFYVNEANYQNSTIKLKCFDNMVKFDEDYKKHQVVYPATLLQIVQDACTVCGVTLATTTFPHNDYIINDAPTKETNFREVLSWVAQIAGCYATCNADGELELKWCDQTLLANLVTAIRQDTAIPQGVYELSTVYSVSAATDDTVITGISVSVENDLTDDQTTSQTQQTTDGSITFTVGNPGFMIALSNNQFFTVDNAQTILAWLGQQLIGLRFRKIIATQLGNPLVETGDIAVVTDRKGNKYPFIITRNNFGINTKQKIVCGSETPAKNSAVRYSEIARMYTQLQSRINNLPTNYSVNNAIEYATELITGVRGGYLTFRYDASGKPYELLVMDHDDVDDASNVLRINLNGIGFSSAGIDGPYKSAWTLDGRFVADFITSGTLSSILIRSPGPMDKQDNLEFVDYWNLGSADIIDGDYTYTGNTLQTHHLRAINDIYVNGGPGSYWRIPTENDDLSYVEMSNGGMTVVARTQLENSLYELTTLYPSISVIDHASDTTTDLLESPLVDYKVFGEVSNSTMLYTKIAEPLDPHEYYEYNVTQGVKEVKFTAEAGTFDQNNEKVKDDANAATYGAYGILIEYDGNGTGEWKRIFQVDESRCDIGSLMMPISFNVNGISLSNLAPGAGHGHYPTASGHYGACAVREESGMCKAMSLGVNASNKTLYVYGSDNIGSLNYIGRVQLA